MSYTVLARRYRSNSFDDLVGQDHIAQTLKKAIESDRLAHAYLFCGTRGTGKTSTARILAKCLNCRSADHPVTQPCGKCDSCKAIAAGEDIDVIEIDAASNTGVDDVRDTIIGTAYNTPARSRFKIFIIDEVHMLSKSAFNALLKTLEEPPSHVKFILATTEPEKMLATILSRCQRYDFRNIPTRQIAAHLKAICKKEKIDADEDALLLVAKAGAGSMRDSLSLLDRLLSLGEKKLTVALIEQMLGLPKAEAIFSLVAAIADGNVKTALTQADAIIAGGLSVDSLAAALVDHLRNLLLVRTCGADSTLIDAADSAIAELATQAKRLDPTALTQDIVILEELRRQARNSQTARALLDATLVRMTLADQFVSISALMDRAAGVAAAPSSLPPVEKKKSDKVIDSPKAAPFESLAGEPARRSGPQVGQLNEGNSARPTSLDNVEPVNVDGLPEQWKAMLDLLAKQGAALHGILSHGKFIGVEDGQAVIRMSKAHETFIRRLESNGKKDMIRGIVSQVLREQVGVRFDLDQTNEVAVAPSAAPAVVRSVPVLAAVPAAPMEPVVRITEELRNKLYEGEPLIRAVVDQLGGKVIRFEE